MCLVYARVRITASLSVCARHQSDGSPVRHALRQASSVLLPLSLRCLLAFSDVSPASLEMRPFSGA